MRKVRSPIEFAQAFWQTKLHPALYGLRGRRKAVQNPINRRLRPRHGKGVQREPLILRHFLILFLAILKRILLVIPQETLCSAYPSTLPQAFPACPIFSRSAAFLLRAAATLFSAALPPEACSRPESLPRKDATSTCFRFRPCFNGCVAMLHLLGASIHGEVYHKGLVFSRIRNTFLFMNRSRFLSFMAKEWSAE